VGWPTTSPSTPGGCCRDRLTDHAAALIEPVAAPVHAVRLAGDVTDRTVAILGDGTMGCCCSGSSSRTAPSGSWSPTGARQAPPALRLGADLPSTVRTKIGADNSRGDAAVLNTDDVILHGHRMTTPGPCARLAARRCRGRTGPAAAAQSAAVPRRTYDAVLRQRDANSLRNLETNRPQPQHDAAADTHHALYPVRLRAVESNNVTHG
jgi:hypothetical protein